MHGEIIVLDRKWPNKPEIVYILKVVTVDSLYFAFPPFLSEE